MTGSTSREYLERRYRESIERAQRAVDPSVARIHREFAVHYAHALGREAGAIPSN